MCPGVCVAERISHLRVYVLCACVDKGRLEDSAPSRLQLRELQFTHEFLLGLHSAVAKPMRKAAPTGGDCMHHSSTHSIPTPNRVASWARPTLLSERRRGTAWLPHGTAARSRARPRMHARTAAGRGYRSGEAVLGSGAGRAGGTHERDERGAVNPLLLRDLGSVGQLERLEKPHDVLAVPAASTGQRCTDGPTPGYPIATALARAHLTAPLRRRRVQRRRTVSRWNSVRLAKAI
jgi:hypothetical protein